MLLSKALLYAMLRFFFKVVCFVSDFYFPTDNTFFKSGK